MAYDRTIPEAADPERAERLSAWAQRKPRVALMGEFSAGKSTLLNFLIEEEMIPTRATATEVPPVWFSHGTQPCYWVDEAGERHPLVAADIASVPMTARYVRIYSMAEILEHCDIVDTPGISDPNLAAESWRFAAGIANLVLWCSSATQAWRETERSAWLSLPERLRRHSLIVVTRADKLAQPDRDKVQRRLARETAGLFHDTIFMATPDAVRAKSQLASGESSPLWETSGAAVLLDRLAERFESIYEERGALLRRHLTGEEEPQVEAVAEPEEPVAEVESLPVGPRPVRVKVGSPRRTERLRPEDADAVKARLRDEVPLDRPPAPEGPLVLGAAEAVPAPVAAVEDAFLGPDDDKDDAASRDTLGLDEPVAETPEPAPPAASAARLAMWSAIREVAEDVPLAEAALDDQPEEEAEDTAFEPEAETETAETETLDAEAEAPAGQAEQPDRAALMRALWGSDDAFEALEAVEPDVAEAPAEDSAQDSAEYGTEYGAEDGAEADAIEAVVEAETAMDEAESAAEMTATESVDEVMEALGYAEALEAGAEPDSASDDESVPHFEMQDDASHDAPEDSIPHEAEAAPAREDWAWVPDSGDFEAATAEAEDPVVEVSEVSTEDESAPELGQVISDFVETDARDAAGVPEEAPEIGFADAPENAVEIESEIASDAAVEAPAEAELVPEPEEEATAAPVAEETPLAEAAEDAPERSVAPALPASVLAWKAIVARTELLPGNAQIASMIEELLTVLAADEARETAEAGLAEPEETGFAEAAPQDWAEEAAESPEQAHDDGAAPEADSFAGWRRLA